MPTGITYARCVRPDRPAGCRRSAWESVADENRRRSCCRKAGPNRPSDDCGFDMTVAVEQQAAVDDEWDNGSVAGLDPEADIGFWEHVTLQR